MSKTQAIASIFLWFAAGIAFVTFTILIFMYLAPIREVIPCQEDEFIVGIGNFDSNGYWDEYVCIHPDTIING